MGLPLERCLDKFTEEEPLDGIVCPKCKSDNGMRKSFALWRLPPVLVVQLKRFHFDNVSRRKLVDMVRLLFYVIVAASNSVGMPTGRLSN